MVAGILGACTDNQTGPPAAENANATTCYGSQKPDLARGPVKLAPQTVQVHRTLERQPHAADPRVGADWVRRAFLAGADGSHLAGQTLDVLCSRPGLRGRT